MMQRTPFPRGGTQEEQVAWVLTNEDRFAERAAATGWPLAAVRMIDDLEEQLASKVEEAAFWREYDRARAVSA